MVSLLPAEAPIRHVIRCDELDIYMLPRAGGLIAVGATVEDAGFDKSVVPETAKALHQTAAQVVPSLTKARIHESWSGLRPGSPDGLPIMGETSVKGYWAATGHYRNGILLAPITAKVMGDRIVLGTSELDLSPFSPLRFE